jgi:hypothetical protein
MRVTADARSRPHLPESFERMLDLTPEVPVHTRLAVLLAVSLFGVSNPVLATQKGSTRLPDGPAVGGSMDRFLYEGSGVTALSFRMTFLRRNSAGTELGISLFPEALQFGALILAPDVGPSYNISLPGATVLLKGGGSALLGLGGGVAAVPGVHLGGGLLVRAGPRAALRLDVIRHWYLSESEFEPIWSIGLGFTGLPRLRS